VTHFAAFSFGVLSWGIFHHHLLPICDLGPANALKGYFRP
jgi:hypothetical protein